MDHKKLAKQSRQHLKTGAGRAADAGMEWLREPGKTASRLTVTALGGVGLALAAADDPVNVLPLTGAVCLGTCVYYARKAAGQPPEETSKEEVENTAEEKKQEEPSTPLHEETAPEETPTKGGEEDPGTGVDQDEFWEMMTPRPARPPVDLSKGGSTESDERPSEGSTETTPEIPSEDTPVADPVAEAETSSLGPLEKEAPPVPNVPGQRGGRIFAHPHNEDMSVSSVAENGRSDDAMTEQNGHFEETPGQKGWEDFLPPPREVGGFSPTPLSEDASEEKTAGQRAGENPPTHYVVTNQDTPSEEEMRERWKSVLSPPEEDRARALTTVRWHSSIPTDEDLALLSKVHEGVQRTSIRYASKRLGVQRHLLRSRLQEYKQRMADPWAMGPARLMLPMHEGEPIPVREVTLTPQAERKLGDDEAARAVQDVIRETIEGRLPRTPDVWQIDLSEGVIRGRLPHMGVTFSGFWMENALVVLDDISMARER